MFDNLNVEYFWRKNLTSKQLIKLLFSIIFILLAFKPAFSQENFQYSNEELINITVYENTSPCVVCISANAKDGASSGAGIVIDASGLILTSKHVIGDSSKATVTMASGKRYEGEILAITGNNEDLALIKIKPDQLLASAKLGDSTKIKVGQKVLAIGNPFGFERTLTTGIISRIDYETQRIQTDAVINPGSSGGPLLDSRGYVIGINQSIFNPDKQKANIGISFAIPINTAKLFLKDLASGLKAKNNNLRNDTVSRSIKKVNNVYFNNSNP